MDRYFKRTRFFSKFLLLLTLTIFVGCPSSKEKIETVAGFNAQEEAGATSIARSVVQEKMSAAEIEELASEIAAETPADDDSEDPGSFESSVDEEMESESKTDKPSQENADSDDVKSSDDAMTSDASDDTSKPDHSESITEKKEENGSSNDSSGMNDGSEMETQKESEGLEKKSESEVSEKSDTDMIDSKKTDPETGEPKAESSSAADGETMAESRKSESGTSSDTGKSETDDSMTDQSSETGNKKAEDQNESESGSVDFISLDKQNAAKKCFVELKNLKIGVNQILGEDNIDLSSLADAFRQLKEVCQSTKCKAGIKFTPFILRKSYDLTIDQKEPFQWSFLINDKNNSEEKRECIILDASGDRPVIKITEDGKWKLAETALFLFGNYTWTLTSGKNTLLESEPFSIIQPEKVTSSIYFPAGDTPQFLELLFKMDLVVDGGTQLTSGTDFYMEPKGKGRIILPVYTYYNEEKGKREKERGGSFGSTTSGPSPTTESIGSVIYGLFVDRFFESFGITDKNDVGFDIYLEDSNKNKIMLYQGNP